MLGILAFATIGLATLAAVSGRITGQPAPLTLLTAALAATIGGLAVALVVQRYRIDPRPQLFKHYCASRPSLLYVSEPDETFDLGPFARQGLIPPYTTAHLDHQIMGRHRGIAFEIVSVHLDKRRRSMERYVARPVFQGVLIAIDAQHRDAAKGPILIGRAKGRAARSGAGWRRACRKLSSVTSNAAGFGDAYRCFAADQPAAQRLLDGPVAACLSALAEATPRSPIKAALNDGMFLLALPLPNWICRRPGPFRPCRRLAADVDRLDGVVALVRALAAGLSQPVSPSAQ